MQHEFYSVEDARELDRREIAAGTPAYTLMCRAGEAALDAARQHWPSLQSVCVVCGSGNNGGDGFVFARLARAAGLDVALVALGEPQPDTAAAQARADWGKGGGKILSFEGELPRAALIVDALFGIGLGRAPAAEWAAAIRAIMAAEAPVLALDCPSGVDADSGAVPGEAVRAAVTVTFIVHKRGLVTGAALDHCGIVELASLDLPAARFEGLAPAAESIPDDFIAERLPARRRDTHKGAHGHLLVVGGAPGMGGAAMLAGETALRCGTGRVSVAIHPDTKHSGCAELMVHAIRSAAELAPLLEQATVIALGPGLGRDDWGRALFDAVMATTHSLVVDADALHLLAERPSSVAERILTPHPGEAAALLWMDTPSVQADRYAAVNALAGRYGGVAVLKGAGSLVATAGEPVAVCQAGNPGMATAGMGDVLTGIIAALCAQGLGAYDAARAGVLLHAQAGDEAASVAGARGVIASDLFLPLRRRLN